MIAGSLHMDWLPDEFKRATLTLGGGRSLDYLEGGTGAPVVYLHGAGGPRISPALRESCAARLLLVPVYPGFEGTVAPADASGVKSLLPALAVFIRTCAGGTCDVVAQSLGGHVALWLAATHPGLISSMLLQCPAGFRKGERPRGDPMKLLYAHPERIPEEPQYRSRHAEANQQAAALYRATGFDQELWERLPAIQCRVLLLHGTDDRLLDPEVSFGLSQQLQCGRFEPVSNAGHAIEIDRPEVFTLLMREHLSSTSRSARLHQQPESNLK